MTQREFYETIVNAGISDEITEFAKAAIEKLDKANERHKALRDKKKEEDLPLIDAIKKVLTNEPKTAKEIAAEVEISTQKAAALLKAIVGEGYATITEIKIKGKGKSNAYIVAA